MASSIGEDLDGEMEDFSTDIGEIEDIISDLRYKIQHLKISYESAIYSIGTQLEKVDEQCQLILEEFIEVRNAISALRKYIGEKGQGERVRGKITEYGREVETLMGDYRRIKTECNAKYKEQILHSVAIYRKDLNEQDQNELTDLIIVNPQTNQIYGNMLQQSLLPNQRHKDTALCNLVHLREQYRDLIALEHAILELQNIFIDTAFLIDSQDQQVNNIGRHIDNAAGHIEESGKHLKQARKYKTSERKKCCCLGAVVCAGATAAGGAIAASVAPIAACTIS